MGVWGGDNRVPPAPCPFSTPGWWQPRGGSPVGAHGLGERGRSRLSGGCRCGRAGALRAALGTAEPWPPPRRLGMERYKKPAVCAALGAVIFTRVCAERNAWV